MTKDLFIKYLQGSCTEDEFNQVINWLKNESKTDSARKMVEAVWEDYEYEEDNNEKLMFNYILNRIYQNINVNTNAVQRISRENPLRRLLPGLMRVAALLLLPVLGLYLYEVLYNQGRNAYRSKDLEIVAPAFTRVNVELSDGTKVCLNQGSKLRYPYSFERNTRKVFLTGEAYFEVAHDKKVPFVVEANELEVKATGTAFNVCAYPEDNIIETTLDEGEIIVYKSQSHQELKTMIPKETLRFNLTRNAYSVETGNTDKYTAWKDGRLVFRNDSLSTIIKKLERWYNIDVEITNEKVRKFTFTATFTNETLPQVLDLMTLPTPVSYKLIQSTYNQNGSSSKQKVLIGLKTTK